MSNTTGPDALRAWLDEDPRNRKKATVGAAIGVTGQSITNWLSGAATPTLDKQRLLRALGVAWPVEESTPPELVDALSKAREEGARFRRLAREGTRRASARKAADAKSGRRRMRSVEGAL